MKIAIIGYSGSGKSSLAKYLGDRLCLAVLHLDSVHWLPGWEERPADEEVLMVGRFLDGETDWVIDGNYSGVCYERRLEEADRIIFMNFARITCLFRAFKRYFAFRGKTRDSMGEGCEEKMDFAFVRWILFEGRSSRHRERYKNILRKYAEKTIVIKNQRELTYFMEGIDRRKGWQ